MTLTRQMVVVQRASVRGMIIFCRVSCVSRVGAEGVAVLRG